MKNLFDHFKDSLPDFGHKDEILYGGKNILEGGTELALGISLIVGTEGVGAVAGVDLVSVGIAKFAVGVAELASATQNNNTADTKQLESVLAIISPTTSGLVAAGFVFGMTLEQVADWTSAFQTGIAGVGLKTAETTLEAAASVEKFVELEIDDVVDKAAADKSSPAERDSSEHDTTEHDTTETDRFERHFDHEKDF